MRPLPQHDRAALVTDAAELRRCAARLQELTAQLPHQTERNDHADSGRSGRSGGPEAGRGGAASEDGPDWPGILAVLTRRCLAAAADLDHAASLYAEDAGPDGAGPDDAADVAAHDAASGPGASLARFVDGAGAAFGLARRAWPGRATDPDALVREGPVEL